MILHSRGFVRSRDILNALYIHLHQANGHQTWEVDEGNPPINIKYTKYKSCRYTNKTAI